MRKQRKTLPGACTLYLQCGGGITALKYSLNNPLCMYLFGRDHYRQLYAQHMIQKFFSALTVPVILFMGTVNTL